MWLHWAARCLAAVAVGTALAFCALGPDRFDYWLDRYQSMLSGIATLAGASLAFVAVQRQIRAASRLAREARKRQAYAARAMLSLSLHDISGYASRCIAAFEQMREAGYSGGVAMPPFPREALAVLRTAIETLPRHRAAEIAALIASAQVQSARIGGLADRMTNNSDVTNYSVTSDIVDAAALYEMASRLFTYSRSNSDRLETVAPDRIRAALWLTGVNADCWPHLDANLDARANYLAQLAIEASE